MNDEFGALADALRWCSAQGMDIPTVLAACASVGIERKQSTAAMLIEYVEFRRSENEQ